MSSSNWLPVSRSEITAIARRLGCENAAVSYFGMMSRCLNQEDASFPNYGARGVVVCDRWKGDPESFFADMGEREARWSIDRIDPYGNYEPENCRWAAPTLSNLNTRANRPLVEALEDVLEIASRAHQDGGVNAAILQAICARIDALFRHEPALPIKTRRGSNLDKIRVAANDKLQEARRAIEESGVSPAPACLSPQIIAAIADNLRNITVTSGDTVI